MTVVPDHVDPRIQPHFQMANVVETLRQAADILEPHGLVMVLEPLNTLRNHPGMFLTTTPQAYLICRAVASPSCKILYDIYHQPITEGNLIPNIDMAWDDPAFIVGVGSFGGTSTGAYSINSGVSWTIFPAVPPVASSVPSGVKARLCTAVMWSADAS